MSHQPIINMSIFTDAIRPTCNTISSIRCQNNDPAKITYMFIQCNVPDYYLFIRLALFDIVNNLVTFLTS